MKHCIRFTTSSMLAALVVALLALSPAATARGGHGGRGACRSTSKAALLACKYEARDDYWIAVANCFNLGDDDALDECLDEARDEYHEAREECRDQYDARLEVCEEVGPGPYDPQIDPEDFVDFEAVIEEGEEFEPSPYISLVPGTVREYLATDEDGEVFERVLVEVLHETREILGVDCIVVRDRVWEIDEEGEEELVEDTFDWLGQNAQTGDVWYFGENAKDYEDGEIVSLEGSFEAGIDFAKPGIWVLADPEAGDFYRQEFALGDAEDVAEVLSVGEESVTVPIGTFDGVLVTKDWTPLEPDGFELKFYAIGVGLVMELDPESGERLELVNAVNP